LLAFTHITHVHARAPPQRKPTHAKLWRCHSHDDTIAILENVLPAHGDLGVIHSPLALVHTAPVLPGILPQARFQTLSEKTADPVTGRLLQRGRQPFA
jgi:hypothetical protein